jgi:hypothetical protein
MRDNAIRGGLESPTICVLTSPRMQSVTRVAAEERESSDFRSLGSDGANPALRLDLGGPK